MKQLICIALVFAALGQGIIRADDPIATTPKMLSLELSILRFKPASSEQVLADYKLSGGVVAVVETLRGMGKSVDILCHGTRTLVLDPKMNVKFDATETRPVLVLGKPNTAPAIVYGLTMQLTARPAAKDAFVLAWEGSLNWSPDLLDRRANFPNALQFLGKAVTAAKSLPDVTGKSQAVEIGLAVADLFKEDSAKDSSIYELPVLKTVSVSGSRVCHGGDCIVNMTASEAGCKEPQIIFFVLNAVVE